MNIEDESLTDIQIGNFLKMIKVKRNSNSLSFLNEIILGIFENIPFQNLTLINTKKRPSNELIIKLMLSGAGGLCNVRNGFLYILLNTLGFKVCFLSATIGDIKNGHVILMVSLESKKYIVDTGNGYPYLEAIDIDNSKNYTHPYCTYRIIKQKNSSLCMQHEKNKKWNTIFYFSTEPKVFSSFSNMLDKQYSQKGFGPFLTGIKINKWSKDGGIIVRDKICSVYSYLNENKKYEIKNFDDFKIIIEKYFAQNKSNKLINIKKAWGDIYDKNNH